MADDLPVAGGWVIPAAELVERFSRSSGPGGQGVNTADTRVQLSFDVAGSPSLSDHLRARVLERLGDRLVDGVITVTASEHRTQIDNRRAARDRLTDVLREAAAPPPREASGHPADPRLEGAAADREEAPRRDQAGPAGPLRVTWRRPAPNRTAVRSVHPVRGGALLGSAAMSEGGP